MRMQYEKIVKIICGDNWNSNEIPSDEKDGAYGVAIVLAMLGNVPPKMLDLSSAIGVSPNLLENAYKRLQINGVLNFNSQILRDPLLTMSNAKTEEQYNSCIRAWCHIAGMASGYVGKGISAGR